MHKKNSQPEKAPAVRPDADGAGVSLDACARVPGGAALLAMDAARNWKGRGFVPWATIGPLVWAAWQQNLPPVESVDAPWLADLITLLRRWADAGGDQVRDFDITAAIRAACLNGLERWGKLTEVERIERGLAEWSRELTGAERAAALKRLGIALPPRRVKHRSA